MKPRTWPLDVYIYKPWFEVSEDDRVGETMVVFNLFTHIDRLNLPCWQASVVFSDLPGGLPGAAIEI